MINEERGYMTKVNNMIPEGARYIIHEFARYGHQAYLVGGCVRDIILNRTPHDWDICTDATPEKMELLVHCIIKREEDIEKYCESMGRVYVKKRIKTIPTGLKHGTLTIVVDDEPYEVTTFRCDGKYSDGRRPDSVSFTNSLLDDLQRRDFTINAIAYSMFQGFIDPYHGMKDIENKVIRCVGNPDDRFNEDGLRILRAIRFAAQLRFDIKNSTAMAIHENKHLLDKISRERINSELCKILSSDYCGNKVLRKYADVICQFIPEVRSMIGFEQNNPYHPHDVWEHTLHCMDYLRSEESEPQNDLIVRLAVLFHDIGKPNCYTSDENGVGHFYGHAVESAKITHTVLTNLKFSNEIIDNTIQLIEYHDVQFVTTKASVKRLLNKLGEEQLKRLFVLRLCDISGQNNWIVRAGKIFDMKAILEQILEENECFKLKDLAINGKDLIQCGVPEGKTIGTILNTLLTMVIDGEINNDKDSLLQMTHLLLKSRGDCDVTS